VTTERTTPAEGDVAISVRNVYKVFGGNEDGALSRAFTGTSKEAIQELHGSVLALSDVTFEVKRGELFVVMGLSGCGKSTLVRCINRLIEPSSGEVWLGDREITAMDGQELRELRRSEVAMVFQHYGLLPHRSVLDNVSWGLEVNGVEKRQRRERAEEALGAVGLNGWGDRMTDQLSGGMKQRVGLARALAQDAPVLLMDEPFSALDPVIRRELQDELAKLQSELRKTIIFITHDLDEAVRIGDRIAIMRDGVIVQMGEPSDVVLSPANDFVREFTRDVRLQSMVTAASVMRAPTSTAGAQQAVSEVLATLEGAQRLHALVVDGEGRYAGSVDLVLLRNALDKGDGPVGAVAVERDSAVVKDAVLDELVPRGLRSDHPLPVVDDDAALVGEIPLEALAAAMAAGEGPAAPEGGAA
jgi:glycine betaine/proline transport system ATP-binding protein